MASRFLSIFALFFGLCFASPLLIILANRDDITFSLPWFSVVSFILVLVLSSTSYFLSGKTSFAKQIATASLTCALVFMIQGNIVHDLFYYGAFNGESVNWRLFGWKFWLEWIGFLLAFPVFYWLLSRVSNIPVWLILIPVVSSIFLIAPSLLSQEDTNNPSRADDEIKPEVFEFSSSTNLIHLIPDGFQGDIAREVLEDQPELAARLKGFTLYSDHLGMYQGTAPSVPTMFTGRPFDLEAGNSSKRTVEEINLHSYQARLLEEGYQLDYVTIASRYCVKDAASCVQRPFNDLKSRGYFRYKNEGNSYAFRLLADLTLFRQVPMFLKERVYNDGKWLLANTTMDGSSPWPDPVLREWIDNMSVVGSTPRFKSYHYIGTHIPPLWDESCTWSSGLERNRKQYYNQSVCILTGIANFCDKLRELGIYDQTAIIISGDHGVYIDPDDIQGKSANGSLKYRLVGAARPVLMVKPLLTNSPFQISKAPTSLLDIAPTALSLVGLKGDYSGQAVMSISSTEQRERVFKRYLYEEFWSGKSVSHDTWLINGAVSDLANWSLFDVYDRQIAQSGYEAINYNTVSRTSRGLSLNKLDPKSASSWINGHELSILVGTKRPKDPAVIRMTLRLPEFMDADIQTFYVDINHQRLEEGYSLSNRKDWQHIDVPVPASVLREGNNLVTLKFSETAFDDGHQTWRTAGQIKKLSLIQ